LNSRQVEQDVLTAYRRVTWKIWVHPKANPDVLAENNKRVILGITYKQYKKEANFSRARIVFWGGNNIRESL
jgi:hypothetical protein